MNLEIVADFACGCAEGPLWHPDHQKLYFTDVMASALYCLDPESGRSEKIYEGDRCIGGMTLHEDGRLLLFMDKATIALYNFDGEFEIVVPNVEGEEDSRFNDVVADPQGGVFCGTMPVGERPGRLYYLAPDRTLVCIREEAGLPNGMDFSLDLDWFYFTDSHARTIERYPYHQSGANLSGGEVWVQVPEGEGNPDGLTVDSEGIVWSARYGGSCLVGYTPEGVEIERIDVPMARDVTCPVFAGAELRDLYITTAGGFQVPKPGDSAGALLRIAHRGIGRRAFCSRFDRG